MYEFHKDKHRYFTIQKEVTEQYIIPFLEDNFEVNKPQKVLEIGSAEAGVLKAFTQLGHQCLGIELSEQRVELAKQFMASEVVEGSVSFISSNIYDIDPERDLANKFDLIILKDVIEHIHEQEKFLPILKKFLNPNGKVFFAFPPWQMPFGGHQQNAKSKVLSKLPYVHLLPMFMYKWLLKSFGLSQGQIDGLVEVKETGISIEKFERLIKDAGFTIEKKKFFLFNPIYKWKFGVNPREQFAWISAIPYIRNYFTFGVYYTVS